MAARAGNDTKGNFVEILNVLCKLMHASATFVEVGNFWMQILTCHLLIPA